MPLNKGELAKSAKRLDIYEFREGMNLLRVLPPDMKYFAEDIGYIAFKYITHWGVGPEGSPPVTCPRTRGDTSRCPICEKVRQLKNNPAYKELVDSIYPRTRYVYNILDVEHPEKGIQVMETGPTIYNDVLKCALDADYGDVLDLQSGRNFKITLTPGSKTKTGWNKYDVLPAANPSDINQKLPEGWKQKLAELEGSIREPLSFEELEALLQGSTSETQKTEATPPASAKVTEAPAPSPKNVTEASQAASTPPQNESSPPQSVSAAPAGNPPCFGKEYSPSAERCKACSGREACVTEFVRT